MSCFDYIFLGIGLLFSLFYGFRCFAIHEVPKKDRETETETRIHQYWFNFVGAIAGWFALFILYKSLGQVSDNWSQLANIAPALKWNHYILLLIGIIGVVGYLPFTLVNLIRVPDKLMEAVKTLLGK